MLTQIPFLFLSVLGFVFPAEQPTDLVRSDAVSEIADFEDLAPALQDEEKKEELKEFTGSINVGASASFGNTEIKKANVNALATWNIDEKNRMNGLFDWLYTQQKDQVTRQTEVTQRRVRGALQYDHLFTKRFYGFLRADAISDGLQNLDLRGILSAGAGYQFIDEKDEKLAGELGLAYTHEDFEGQGPDDYIALRVAAKYFRQINEDLKFTATIEWLPSLEDNDDQVVLGTSQFDYNIGKGFVTSFRYEFDYDNTPVPGNDRLDHRLIWGLGYSF